MPEPSSERAALGYAARGWSVVPIESGAKRPLVRWEPYQRTRASEEAVRDWFRRWPGAGVGIVTGSISGLVVLDVDPGHGGARSLADLEARHGPLPATLEACSGGGGRHLYFAHATPELRSRVALAPGIDVRAEGGVVVAPPSLHPSGRRYAWRPGCGPQERPPAALPDWLVAWLRSDRLHPGHPLAHWRVLVAEGVREGERNQSVASLTGHLLWQGVDPEVARELLLCWNRVRCRPPLSDEEVARTVESILRTHFRKSERGDEPA